MAAMSLKDSSKASVTALPWFHVAPVTSLTVGVMSNMSDGVEIVVKTSEKVSRLLK